MDRGLHKYPRFLVNAADVSEGYIRLRGDEAHHVLNVLRMQRGDIFVAIDGKGQEYLSEVELPTGDGALIARVLSEHRRSNEPLLSITLAQGLPQGKKAAEVVERATEVGVNRIIFFTSDKAKPGAKGDSLGDKLRRVAVSAVKQSGRSVIPEIKGPVSFAEVMMSVSSYDAALICDPNLPGEPLTGSLSAEGRVITRILLAVGGESGFSAEETEEATRIGFKPFNLGKRRLRTELAGCVAAAIILHYTGDMGPVGR
ncbi:MAG: 16S rRNA (uracil(1498)-N(3))-methyltransferase [bacterium]|nr:16S rRNA (uracil(1498)-N(3))-methyltransferase [bacterium]